MANRKISDLTALTTPASGDYLPIVDISEAAAADKNKRITVEELMRGVPSGTAGAPGIAFEADPNTGIYSPGADQLAISTGGTLRMLVDSSGRLLVGTSTSRVVTAGISDNWNPQLQVTKTGTDAANIAAYSFSTYAVDLGGGLGIGPDIVLARSNSNTEGTQTAIDDNMLLGRITFNGSDGTAFRAGAFIAAASDGQTWASGDCPTRLAFSTTADGASSPTERLRIDSSGRLLVGTSSNSGGALLQVNGNRIRVATAKTPASASDTGTTGEICWDASYIYVCTATNTWKRAALATW